MGKEIIERYVKEVLYSRLKGLNIQEKYIQNIQANIKKQIYSLLYHWNDKEFRKAILVIGMEEGFFYEPEANLDIKSFVVVTIRNSYIEDIFSIGCKSINLDKSIDEELIKLFTKEAIEYFKEINFVELSKDINKLEIEDIYDDIIKQYPLAWNALIQLANCVGKKVIYKGSSVQEKLKTKELNKMYKDLKILKEEKVLNEVQSGIDEEISQELIRLLNNLSQDEGNVFYVDCFKMLTRNFKKLLFIIEVLLENKNCFLTSNYLITDSYIGKRTDVLRAAHTNEEVVKKIKSEQFFCGLSKLHRNILESYTDLI